jgi:hypothetical protein
MLPYDYVKCSVDLDNVRLPLPRLLLLRRSGLLHLLHMLDLLRRHLLRRRPLSILLGASVWLLLNGRLLPLHLWRELLWTLLLLLLLLLL